MDVQLDTAGNLCAQIGAGALLSVEVLSRDIALIETFDDSIDIVALSDLKGRPVSFWCSR